MRKDLIPYVGKRLSFISQIGRFSTTIRFSDKTIMLSNVCLAETGEQVAEHIWLKNGVWAENPKMKVGKTITFKADVVKYKKRTGNKDDRRNRTNDLKLANVGMVDVV